MKAIVGILLCIPFLLWGGYRKVADIQFDRNCEGYLKRAADANTVELAEKQLAQAVEYAERKRLTEGYTSIFYRTPDEDVGFWYENLDTSLQELREVPPDATQLERSNVLMKLRETLLDDKDKGTTVTVPPGITVFPNNALVAFICVLTSISGIGGIILIFIWFEDQ